MRRKPEADHCLPRPLKRRKDSSSQITCEITRSPRYTSSDRAYDVFLNFRGPDSRHTVADVLYRRLTDSGVRVFLDDEGIRKGEVIEGKLLGAITNSRIYIPILSQDYASSKWCLRELAKMVDCWESSNGGTTKKVFLPIFFDVDVSKDVKLRSKMYTTALQKHKDELGETVVKPWKDALRKVATIKGWNLNNHGLSKLADLINEEVFSKLTASEAVPSFPPDGLVGIDKPMEDIMEMVEERSPGVRFIVIHGMGGIGKTTLANAVFKKISSSFQGACFLRDIRQSRSDVDMVKLQQKLLSDILNLNFVEVSNIDDGIRVISKRLRDQNVLIVLDDVDKRDQLLNLAAKSSWFGPQSRIIITTRNIEFLPTKDDKEYCFYEMEEMDHGHALQLFCRHAFEKDRPPLEFYNLSSEIVATTGRLPLSLQVIGSSLYNQDDGTWKFRLEKLKEAPHKDVQETLMISYRALEYEQQQIFLDISCLFNGEKMMDPIYFWEACKLYPNSGIKILIRRSMIKVYDDGTLWVHDQLRDLGRAISQAKIGCLKSELPPKPSRLWSPEVALDVMRKQEVDESIIALNLGALDADFCFVREQFAQAVNLKFLQLQGGNFEGDFKNVLQQLIWLSWSDGSLRFEVTNLSFRNLVILKLSRYHIVEESSGWGVFVEAKQLKVLHLEDCKCLKRTLNFSTFMGLERLILRDCVELEEIDISMNKLERLNYLEISNKTDDGPGYISAMPAQLHLMQGSIEGLKSLEVLKICNVGLTELHPSIGQLLHLNLLCLICPQLGNLPKSLGKLIFLVELDLSYSGIRKLPASIGDLKQLKILRMNNSALKYLPWAIGRLDSLEELNLFGTKITVLPKTIRNLKMLKMLDVSWSCIKTLPKALVKLENLEILRASSCIQMDGKLPEGIGKLSRLRTLYLLGTTISRVPTTINHLSHLHELNLEGIHEPQELSRLPTSLISLSVKSSSLESHQVPDLSFMTNLVDLDLMCDINIDPDRTLSPCKTPPMKWLAMLPKLEGLSLSFPDLISPPTELSSLSCLQSLMITCFNPQSLTHLPYSLKSLNLCDVKSPIDWQLLSSLKNLSSLALSECWLKDIEVDCLEHLLYLRLFNCESLERLSNLSSLKELRELYVYDCPRLVDVEGLEELKKLDELHFLLCESLESVPHVNEEVSCHLTLSSCEHFPDFSGPYSLHHHAITT